MSRNPYRPCIERSSWDTGTAVHPEITKAIDTLRKGTTVAASSEIEAFYRRTFYEGEIFSTALVAVREILAALHGPGFANTAMGLRYLCDILTTCNSYLDTLHREQITNAIHHLVNDDLAFLEGFATQPDPIARISTTYIVADREWDRDRLLEIAGLALKDEEPIVKASPILMLGHAFPTIELDRLLPKEAIPPQSPAVDAAIANTLLSTESPLFPRAVAAVVRMLEERERYYVEHFLFKERDECDFQGQFPWFESYFSEWLYECACREQYHNVEPIAAAARKIVETTEYDDAPLEVFPIVRRPFPEQRKLRPLADEPVVRRAVLEALAENDEYWRPAKTMTNSLRWLSKDGGQLSREDLLK